MVPEPGQDAGGAHRLRDRRGETLFIDARNLGVMVDRTHRELTDDDLACVAGTYHAWRGEPGTGEYVDVPGFCASATTEEIAEHRYVLTPGRYVGAEEAEEDDEPLDEKMARLARELYETFADTDRLKVRVQDALGRLDV